MKKVKKPDLYETSDGAEFEDRKKAATHEALDKARRDYERARQDFGILLAKTQVTADGVPFELGRWGKYYAIRPGWESTPSLVEVDFWWSSEWRLRLDDEVDRLQIIKWETVHNTHYCREFFIDELYARNDTAKAAWLAACDKWLAERREQIEEWKAKR